AIVGARPGRAIRRPGPSSPAVHGLQQRQVGNARRRPQFLPRNGPRSVGVRRAARCPPAQAHRWRPDTQVLHPFATPNSIHDFEWIAPSYWNRANFIVCFYTGNLYYPIVYGKYLIELSGYGLCSCGIGLSVFPESPYRRLPMVDIDLNRAD